MDEVQTMAPKQKITKEMILEATFHITREHGYENVNARSLASMLGCSTQPIFSRFASMEELKKVFHAYAGKYFDRYAAEAMQGGDSFRKLGECYINFARNESNLFRLLFMSEVMDLHGFADMYDDPENLEVAQTLSSTMGISFDSAKRFYMKMFIFTHGIAAMLASKFVHLEPGEAETMLGEAQRAFAAQHTT
ncbi:TetR/AcrR family transcriptional regulator [Sphaerochaeta globosa]|nr:TetR/AcrR family transcriptional regulator [Sphaerochaeta globosa]